MALIDPGKHIRSDRGAYVFCRLSGLDACSLGKGCMVLLQFTLWFIFSEITHIAACLTLGFLA